MKEICSLIDMSGTVADDDIYEDTILGAEMAPNNDVTSCETNHVTDRSRVSLLDWAESLIQLSVASEDSTSDDHIHNLFSNANNHVRVEEFEENPTTSAKTLKQSSLSGENDTQDTIRWQQVHLDDCLTLTKEDVYSEPLKNPSSLTQSNFPPNDHSPEVHKQDVATGCDVSSTRTNKATTNLNNSSNLSSCVLSQRDSRSLLRCHHHDSTPPLERNLLFTQTSNKPPFCERQLTPDNLTVEHNDQFTSDLSLFNVDIDMSTSGINIPITLIPSSNPSSNQSLNTPVLEAYPPLKTASGSHVEASCGTNLNVQTTNLISSSDSQTLSVASPENYIDLTNLSPHDDVMLSTHANSMNNQTNQSNITIHFSEPSQVFQEDDIPFTWTEDNLEGITVLIPSESEECPSNSSFQLLQLHSNSDTSLQQTDTTFPQNLESDMTVSGFEIVELPSDIWIGNLSEGHTSQLDISKHAVSHTWSPDCLPCSQETGSSIRTSLGWDSSDDLIIHDPNELHNYCVSVNSEKRLLRAHETWKVIESSAIPQTESTGNSSFINTQHAFAISGIGNSVTNLTTEALPFKNDTHPETVASKHIIHPKHRTKRLNKTLIRNNKTITRFNNTSVKCNDKLQQLSPESHTIEQPKENHNNESTNRSLEFTPPIVSVLNESQFDSVTPCLKSHPYEMSFSVIVSPEDVYTPSVSSDILMSLTKPRSNTVEARTSPDISDFSFGDTEFSLTSASYTDGEGSQEPLTGDKLKDTLRSRLKAKRKMNAPSQENFELQDTGTHFNFGLNILTPASHGCPSTSIATQGSAGQCKYRRVLNSRRSSDSCSSSMSPDGASDTDSIYTRDDEDSTSIPSPPQTTERKEKETDEHMTNYEKRLAKRERNRLAAQKCRRKKTDKVDMLTEQIKRLELKQQRIRSEVTNLEGEKEELQEMLRLHSFFCTKDGGKKK